MQTTFIFPVRHSLFPLLAWLRLDTTQCQRLVVKQNQEFMTMCEILYQENLITFIVLYKYI